jgi:protein-S-isoprenylcysteine O-methyltransferase Ste14
VPNKTSRFVATALFLFWTALLFVGAGTLRWPVAWGYVAFSALKWGIGRAFPYRYDQSLFDARAKWRAEQKKVKPTRPDVRELVLVVLQVCALYGWPLLMGADALRFHWSVMPVWLRCIGAAGLLVAWPIADSANREWTVAVRKRRGTAGDASRILDTGLYARVRHPSVSAVLIRFPATALFLGSWLGLAMSAVLVALAIGKMAAEDRQLRLTWPRYGEYAARVPARLIPGLL